MPGTPLPPAVQAAADAEGEAADRFYAALSAALPYDPQGTNELHTALDEAAMDLMIAHERLVLARLAVALPESAAVFEWVFHSDVGEAYRPDWQAQRRREWLREAVRLLRGGRPLP